MAPKKRRNSVGFYKPFDTDLAAARNRQSRAIQTYCEANNLPDPQAFVGSDTFPSARAAVAQLGLRDGDHLVVVDLRCLWDSPTEFEAFVERTTAMRVNVHVISLGGLLTSYLAPIQQAMYSVGPLEERLAFSESMRVTEAESHETSLRICSAMAIKTATNAMLGLKNDLNAIGRETIAAVNAAEAEQRALRADEALALEAEEFAEATSPVLRPALSKSAALRKKQQRETFARLVADQERRETPAPQSDWKPEVAPRLASATVGLAASD